MGILGGLISAGASILGGILGSKDAEKDRAAAAEQARLNYEQQKEFAQHGVRWKVEDAKAAGLHPLYALGGTGAAFAPNPIVVGGDRSMGQALADAGQHLGRAVSAQETPEQRSVRLMQLRAMEAQAGRDDAQAALAWTTAMRDFQNNQGQPGMPNNVVVPRSEADVSTHPVRTHPLAVDAVELKADPQVSQESGKGYITASPGSPGLKRWNWMDGLQILLPQGESMSEALESITESWAAMYGVLNANVREFGDEWLYKFVGMPPPYYARDKEEAMRMGVDRIMRNARRLRGDRIIRRR